MIDLKSQTGPEGKLQGPSGQIEHIDLGGEAYGGLRPCRYEWVKQISDACAGCGNCGRCKEVELVGLNIIWVPE